MYDFQKHTPQNLVQNRILETVPICIILQCFPHDNIVCIHMCDGCKISSDSVVCHKLSSISQSIVQVCSLTREYQGFHYVPNTSISEHFVSILLPILLQISFPPLCLKNACMNDVNMTSPHDNHYHDRDHDHLHDTTTKGWRFGGSLPWMSHHPNGSRQRTGRYDGRPWVARSTPRRAKSRTMTEH